ncbi:cation diffusion facilitator family transporter [Methanococcoides alaskense]|uniref:Cation diffusion facilitator family transporter n=1 Tax=Methanococcoides alaskense TaxID=325778 RepID=A0AA90Z8G7_9EURY|nr:cation transporter dimerization domain-containing protein [Methanococcoides alaskense]MDA0525753.1 hypothetical protein [Methanococcoides alaskense]MDR6222979.1 cation diffusion facilitator family transporter [Methanococcoides alaskense]
MRTSIRKNGTGSLALSVFIEIALLRIFAGSYSDILAVQVTGYFALFIGIIALVHHFVPSIISHSTDHVHPYGYRKYSSLVSLFIAIIFILASLYILSEVHSTVNGSNSLLPDTSIYILLLMSVILSVAILKYCSLDEFDQAGISHSFALKLDVMFSVLIALTLFIQVSPTVLMLETVLLVLVLMKYCVSIVLMSCNVLCDACCLDESNVRRLVRSIEGIENCYKVRTHGSPDDLFVDIHVKVDSDIYVMEAQRIVESIERKLKRTFTGISDVLVHIEPPERR